MKPRKLYRLWAIPMISCLMLTPSAWGQTGSASEKAANSNDRSLPSWPAKPDPAPMKTIDFLEIRVALQKSKLSVMKIEKKRFSKPQILQPRYTGPFEARLFAGAQLKDVIRFSFPLTQSSGAAIKAKDQLGQALSQGVSARTTIRIPFDETITYASLYDSLRNKSIQIDLKPFRPVQHIQVKPESGLRTKSFRQEANTASPPAPSKKSK